MVRLGLEDQAVSELVARPLRTDKPESANLIGKFRIRQADEQEDQYTNSSKLSRLIQ